MKQMPTLANPQHQSRWGLINSLIITLAFLFYSSLAFSDEIPQPRHTGPFYIDSFYGSSSENEASYYGINLALITPERNQQPSYYGLLKFARLDDETRASQEDDLDELFLGGGIQLNGFLTPYLEAGIDVLDPGGQIFDRFGDGFEILINEIFNNNFDDCRDDDTCTSIQFDRYIKVGVKARINRTIEAGVFYERTTINSEDGDNSFFYNILGVNVGVRF